MSAPYHREDCECGDCWPVVYVSPPAVTRSSRAVDLAGGVRPDAFPLDLGRFGCDGRYRFSR